MQRVHLDWVGRTTLNDTTVTFSNEGAIRARIHCPRVFIICREMCGQPRKFLDSIFVTARFSLIFVVAVVVFVIWGKRFLQSSENLGKFSSGFGLPSAPLRYVVKAAGFALTSSIARTNRSQRSRELSGRMTGGGLISEQDSLVTSSNLGRYSSSLTRWRSKRNENDNFIFIGTALTTN